MLSMRSMHAHTSRSVEHYIRCKGYIVELIVGKQIVYCLHWKYTQRFVSPVKFYSAVTRPVARNIGAL